MPVAFLRHRKDELTSLSYLINRPKTCDTDSREGSKERLKPFAFVTQKEKDKKEEEAKKLKEFKTYF
jgi:hypothetical protein